MTSNLLAHHVGVLDRAGLVSRHRSEADRRRSYVQLVPAALDGLLSTAVQPVTRVVFVCTANTARSQLAAALWTQASDVPATSAGTHPAETIAPGALRAAARHGLDLPESPPRHLADVVTAHDLVVTVCDNAHEELATRPDPTSGPSAGGADAARVRRLHWSVADPVPTGDLGRLRHRLRRPRPASHPARPAPGRLLDHHQIGSPVADPHSHLEQR